MFLAQTQDFCRGFWIGLPFSFGGRPLPDHIIRPDAIFISNGAGINNQCIFFLGVACQDGRTCWLIIDVLNRVGCRANQCFQIALAINIGDDNTQLLANMKFTRGEGLLRGARDIHPILIGPCDLPLHGNFTHAVIIHDGAGIYDQRIIFDGHKTAGILGRFCRRLRRLLRCGIRRGLCVHS